MSDCAHEFEEYALTDEDGDTYYTGWDCALCGAEGYAVDVEVFTKR